VRIGAGMHAMVSVGCVAGTVLHGATVNPEPENAVFGLFILTQNITKSLKDACFSSEAAKLTHDASSQRVSLFKATPQHCLWVDVITTHS
jgi:hypothetical protein